MSRQFLQAPWRRGRLAAVCLIACLALSGCADNQVRLFGGPQEAAPPSQQTADNGNGDIDTLVPTGSQAFSAEPGAAGEGVRDLDPNRYIDPDFLDPTPPVPGAIPSDQPIPPRPTVARGTGDLIRVGLLLPFSGASAQLGEAMRDAAVMAQFELADDRFVLQFYDTRGTPEGAAQAATLAVSQGAELILGPLFSHSVRAVAAPARNAGVPVVAFTTDPSAVGDGVFTIGFLLRQQVDRIVQYAAAQGFLRFALLAPDNVTGRVVAERLQEAAGRFGVQVTRSAFFDPAAADLSAVAEQIADYAARKSALEAEKARLRAQGDEASMRALERLQSLDTLGSPPYDAIMIPAEGVKLRQVASGLTFYDVEPEQVQFLGTMLWDDPSLANENALLGGWYPAASKAAHEPFANRYRDAFNREPPRLASLAYDGVALAAVISQSERDNRFTIEALTAPSGFLGVDGIFRLLPDGTSERGLAVMEIARDGPEEIAPAPLTFEAPRF